ncbi:MAG: copper chaperone PCu(A)C [Alphaproteobacteria bacterium]|nr:copper chaperone PCu(A)C [Alphaproteobacteria bacterium]
MARILSLIMLGFLSAVSVVSAAPLTGVEVIEAWTRPGTKDGTTAAYMELKNNNPHAVVIQTASSTMAREVQLHETKDEDGVMKMRQQASWTIEPGQTLVLRPGSYHIMLIGLHSDVTTKDTLALTLATNKGETLELTLPVKGCAKKTECHCHD